IIIQNLEIGTTVKVRETKTADGFVLDGTPKDIEIMSSDLHELVFTNRRQGALTIRARDSVTQAGLAGVVLRLTYADGRPVDNFNGQQSSGGIYTTDANGEINITGLTGTVIVTEQRTIDGYTMNPASGTQTVIVNPAETQTLTFEDNPNQTLTIQVLASDSREPLAGVRLLVTDSEGTVVGPANGEYVTDQNGRVVITNLVPGVTVTVKETEAVSGYVLNPQPQSIQIRQGEAQSLTLYNDPKGSLTVRLIDAVTDQFLTGGEFRITTARGEPVDDLEGRISSNGIYRVDEERRITITGLLPGVYTVTQTMAPDGYVMSQEPQTVTINADDAQSIVFRNTPLQTLIVQNYAAGTAAPLAGSAFLVTDGDGTVLGPENGVYRTDENGRFVVSGLRPGINIHVKQTSVADGYLLNGNPQNIEIQTGEAQTLTFFNEPCGALVLLARDRETGQPIPGVVFQMMDSTGAFVGNYGGALTGNGLYTSDDSGQVVLHGLEPAVLVVREVSAPDGYVLNDQSQTVEINPAETQTLTFQNAPTLTVTVRMFAEGTTEPLAGVRFLITDGNGANIGAGEYATDENGRIVLPNIVPGTTIIAHEV
ncbi:MAG: hypothetical protein J6X53_06170, partial [Abditibacteriota bacterium]|nr:hypothetical protein [Abditibacteriota bacterium]